MITDKEKRVLDLSGHLWNDFLTLPELHPDDRIDFKLHLHAIQNIILKRSGYRELNKQSKLADCKVDIIKPKPPFINMVFPNHKEDLKPTDPEQSPDGEKYKPIR